MLESAEDQLPTVAVVGSCLTRDNFNSRFNPNHRRWFSVGASSNQMSLIALMAPATGQSWDLPEGMNEYGRRNLTNEFEKAVLAELTAEQPDYVVIDLFGDIHFGVLEVDAQTFVTNNRWNVQKTHWYRVMQAAGRLRALDIYRDTDEYIALWRDAATRLRRFIDTKLPNTTVVVNRGRNTDMLWEQDRDLPVSLRASRPIGKIDVRRANDVWRMLDDELTLILDAQEIDLADVDFGTYDEHPWGGYYVHPKPEFYPAFLGELQQLHFRMRPEQADGDSERVDEILAAWRAKAADDTKTIEALHAQLANEVAARRAAEAQLERKLDASFRGIARRGRRVLGRVRRKVLRHS